MGRPPSLFDEPTATSNLPAGDDRPTSRVISTPESELLESTVRRFEAEWKRGEEPRIDDYLTDAGTHRAALLTHLVNADLECRLKAGRGFLVEVYLSRYPELGEEDAVNLIVHDFALRRRRGMMSTVDDYLFRFPRHKAKLLTRLPSDANARPASPTDPDKASTLIRTVGRSSATAPGPRLCLPKKFEVLERIGAGGMGEVWRVRRPDLGIERAVKLILPGRACDRETIARMLREAQAMARLNHPHAVVVHDVCLGDIPYIEMEFVRGRTLDQVLLQPDFRVTTEWTGQVLEQLCDVLQAAHKIPIVHRDLKPSNLMLADDGSGAVNLKVLDFGISKFLNADPDGFHTTDGQTLGTLLYMSPEQVDSSRALDARSDLYSVGVILYELLNGCRPFTSRFPDIYHDIRYTPAPRFRERNPNSQVPPELENLVLRCLEKEPDLRPASAAALGAEFRRLTTPALIEVEQATGRVPVPVPGPGRRRILVALVSVAGLGALGLYRRLHPVSFSVMAAPLGLHLHAGKAESISLVVSPVDLASKVRVRWESDGLPKGVLLKTRETTAGTQHEFSIVTDPNMIPQAGPVRYPLKFHVSDGRTEQSTSVDLVIHPPDVAPLPQGWERLRGDTKLVEIDGKFHPAAIERRFPEGVTVVALLITRRHGGPDPFYIMRDKVWEGLFELFARDHPKLFRPEGANDDPDPWKSRGGDPFLPVYNVKGVQAQEFARWLGGERRGFLPTCAQWDQAAGMNLSGGRPGPFQEPWTPGDPSQLAVGRTTPLPVGTASRDVSPYGCRDMAGNGWEWTRLPGGSSPGESVELRSESYAASRPFLFKNIKLHPDGYPFNMAGPEIGFRVVIELDPMN